MLDLEGKDLGSQRAVIVGAGLMGHHHALAARDVGTRVVAVVDRDRAAARKLATQFPGARADEHLRDALAASNPTVAHLCTPPETHSQLASMLAEHRLHAMIEKPLAANEAETRAILSDFARTERLICPVHQYAFQRSVDRAVRALPELGRIHRVGFEIRSAGGGGAVDALDQIASDIVPHPLSMLQRLFPAMDLGDLPWVLTRSAPGEWLATATWSGTLVSIAISLGARPTGFATMVFGSNGSIELDNFHDFVVRMSGKVSRGAKITQPFARNAKGLTGASVNLVARAIRRENAYPGLRSLTRLFYAAAESGGAKASPISAAEAIAVAASRDALIASYAAAAHG